MADVNQNSEFLAVQDRGARYVIEFTFSKKIDSLYKMLTTVPDLLYVLPYHTNDDLFVLIIYTDVLTKEFIEICNIISVLYEIPQKTHFWFYDGGIGSNGSSLGKSAVSPGLGAAFEALNWHYLNNNQNNC